MMEERFEELINLYLDNEIGRNELGELKRAIKDNLVRRRKFERACQLNQAARKALTSQSSDSGGAVSVSGSGRRVSEHRSSREEANTGAISSPKVLREKQDQAYRNASVSTLSERQSSSGAAATISISKTSSRSKGESSSDSATGGVIPFFSSTLGMVAGGVLAMLVICGVIYVFEHEEMDPGDDTNANPPSQFSPQLTREQVSRALDNTAKNAQNLLLGPDDSPRTPPEDNLLINTSASEAQPQSYMVSRTDTISASGNQTASYYLHVTQSTYVGPVNVGAGDANATASQPGVTPLASPSPVANDTTAPASTGNSTAPIVPRVP